MDVPLSCLQYDSTSKTYTNAKDVVDRAVVDEENGKDGKDNKAKQNGATGKPQVALVVYGIVGAGLLATIML